MRRIISIALTFCMLITAFGALSISASAAEGEWYDNWTTIYKDFVTFQNGEATIDVGKENKNGFATMEVNVSNGWIKDGTFDVEWGMMIESYGSYGENLQIRTNSARLMFAYSPTAVYISNGKSAQYPIGNDYHTYRAVAKNGIVDIYIDGELVISQSTMQSGSWSNGVLFGGGTTGTNDHKSVWDEVKIHDPNAAPEIEAEEQLELDEDNFKYTPSEVTDELYADFEDGDPAGWPLLDVKNWRVEDGILQVQSPYQDHSSGNVLYDSSSRPINLGYGRDFIFEARIKVPCVANRTGLTIQYPLHRIALDFKPDGMWFNNNGSTNVYGSEEFALNNEDWHDLKIVTSDGGDYATYYFDGEMVMQGKTIDNTEVNGYVYWFGVSNANEQANLQIDSVRIKTIRYDLITETPWEGAEYLENAKINLSTRLKRTVTEENVPSVDYVVNGQVVATGHAPDYKATLSDLPAGSYEIQSVCGDYISEPVAFTVLPRIKGEILGSVSSNGDVAASLNLFDESSTRVSQVVWLLDGNAVGSSNTAPYSLNLSDLALSGHSLTAVCQDESGLVLEKFSKRILPEVPETGASTNYANEFSYTVTGDSGTASVDVSNGNHRLSVTHSKDAFTYLTDTGEESLAAGLGEYHIITDGPYAEFYHNGQYIGSCYMPMTDKAERNVSEDGLRIENYKASVPTERQNYFVKRNVSDKETIYSLPGIHYSQVIDFVASKDDEARIVLNDEYYQTDIILKDGKLTAWTVNNDKEIPYELELGDAKGDGEDVYYRVESVGGVCRLSANGRSMGTFRAIRAEGEPGLAVNVTRGELPYLAVSDYADIYLYQDSFDGQGKESAESFWSFTDMSYHIDEEDGKMTLFAGESDGFATISAYASTATMSADMEVLKETGGVWLFANNDMANYVTRAGYNFETGKYEIVDYEKDNNLKDVTSQVSAEGTFPVGERVRMEIRVQKLHSSKTVSLYVNGQHILTKDDCMIQHGKVGFVVKNNGTYVYDMEYRGNAKPILETNHTINLASLVYFDMPDGALRGVGYDIYDTYDGGKTWEHISSPNGLRAWNVAKLPTGELVSVWLSSGGVDAETGQTLKYFSCSISEDMGDTWTVQYIMPEELRDVAWNLMPGRLMSGPSGRLYLPLAKTVNEDFGYTEIWYSDDKGKSWKVSKDAMDSKVEGYGIQEVTVVELENITRAYIRNDMGMLQWYNSYDRGETWDLTPQRTPFLTTLNMYRVSPDPSDNNTLYAFFTSDNANLHPANQTPRNNYTVAKSTNAGDSWEFVGTVYESDSAYQTYNQMNQTGYVTEKYLISESMGDDDRKAVDGMRTVVFSKEKNIPTKRLIMPHVESVDGMMEVHCSVVNDEVEDRTLIVNTQTGDILLHSTRMEGLASGDAVNLEAAASFLGTKLSVNENGDAVFSCGDSAVTIPAADLTEKDGTKYISLDILAEKYGLLVEEQGNIKILSPYELSGVACKKAMMYTLDPFSNEK